MQFTMSTTVKGTQQSVETIIGTVEIGSKVLVQTAQGNKIHTVTEMNNRWIKTDYQFMKFDNTTLGWVEMGAYATIKIIEVVK